jgi:anti-sigma factor RsiW
MIALAGDLTCRELVDFFHDHLESRLAPDAQAAFDVHLAACTACRAYLRTYADTIRLAKDAFGDSSDAPPDEPPEALVRAILDSRPRLRLVRGGRAR